MGGLENGASSYLTRGRALAGAGPRGEAVAVQVSAMGIEPDLGAREVGIEPSDQSPEARRMIELPQMRDLVRRQIIEHVRGRQDEPPGERQDAGVRARAPAAGLIPDGDALDVDPELGRI